jgi:anti-sigma factor RsiW
MAWHPAPPGSGTPVGAPATGGWHEPRLHDVAAYALEALPLDEELAVEQHIGDCAECQQELAQLREVMAELGTVPEQAFLDGAPENADLLIRGTLRRIRTEETENERRFRAEDERAQDERTEPASRPASRPRFLDLAVAAAAVMLAVTVGAVIGRSTAPAESVAIANPPATSPSVTNPSATSGTASVVPGTRQATSIDPRTGASLTAQVVPAEGWVRVTVATSGIKAGQKCTLYVVSHSGERVVAGSWLVPEADIDQWTTLSGSALTAPADVAAVEVENSSGEVLVRTQV